MTFATTTDGNHGRGVAWAARALGQKAVVYMPKGSAQERESHYRPRGGVYRHRYELRRYRPSHHGKCQKHGWIVVQDTACEGYTKIPTWIMQGYTTLAAEAVAQMKEMKIQRPTHVLLQAGVGAMAGGVLGYLVDEFGAKDLHSIIVEPDLADCLYRSSLKGEIVNVGGDMATIMAGLACGEPNPIGWDLMRNCATQFISCEDAVAALGMRVLGNPYGKDSRVISGESGAVGLGVLAAVNYHPERAELMARLGLNSDSVILVINTEGDTDTKHYREVVWEGKTRRRNIN